MRLTLSHCCCHPRLTLVVGATAPHPRPIDVAPDAVAAPSGPAAAAEAFAWVNRQLTWQSLLADLEVTAWLTDRD